MQGGLLQPGQIFASDFRVVRPLSAGGMGAVYVAEQISTGKERALKVMQPHILQSEDARKRFAQEARVASRIESEHVVEVIGAGFDLDTQMPWLAMELLQGEDLATYLRRENTAGLGMTVAVFSELKHALGAAHRASIVHRDLKPENVFLATSKRAGSEFVVKILDFGIAKILSDATSSTTATIGSPMWMAPEQAQRGMAVSPATDVWALAMIAFRMLSGKLYWRAAAEADPTPMKVLTEMVLEPMDPASVRSRALGGASLPAGFDAWFMKAAAKEPSVRYPEAGAAVDALLVSLGADVPIKPALTGVRAVSANALAVKPFEKTEAAPPLGSARTVDSPPTQPRPAPGTSAMRWAGALALVGGVGGVIWYASRSPESRRRAEVTASSHAVQSVSSPQPIASVLASAEELVVPPLITSSSTGHFGGNGGADLTLPCGEGEVMRGIFGTGEKFFYQVGVLCGVFTGWEAGRATFKRTVKVGPVGQFYKDTKQVELECPRDAALVTLSVGRIPQGAGFMVGSVSLECAPIVRKGKSWEIGQPFMTEEVKFELSVIERSRRHCESGVALGLIGRSGAWTDALGLSCGAPALR